MKNKYSITSNSVKLFKHLDELKSLQIGIPRPILLHVMPTTKCNLKCENCCFAEANAKETKHLDLKVAKETLRQFMMLGTRAIEITGFGDPSCYKYINELVDFAYSLGMKIGMNTNGHLAKNITNWQNFAWVRLSMNTLDFYELEKAYPLEYIRKKAPNLQLSGCYVNTSKVNKTMPKILKFAEKNKIMVRVVPNCIDSNEGIKEQIKHLKTLIPKDNKYVFVSDFNIELGKRRNNNCHLHLVKPALAPDGYVYSCPSSELAIENGTKLNAKFRICKGVNVYKHYTSKEVYNIPQHNCSYCKYKHFNEILEDVLTESEFNDFT